MLAKSRAKALNIVGPLQHCRKHPFCIGSKTNYGLNLGILLGHLVDATHSGGREMLLHVGVYYNVHVRMLIKAQVQVRGRKTKSQNYHLQVRKG